MQTPEPLVCEPIYFEDEIATGKLKRYKISGTDQIPAKLIEAKGNTLRYDIHKLVNSI
jgi:hypothetical protein